MSLTLARASVQPGLAAKRRGLLDVAQIIDSSDPHAVLGGDYLSLMCGLGDQWATFCTTNDPQVLNDPTLVENLIDPVTVTYSVKCSPAGNITTGSDVSTALEYRESREVETVVRDIMIANGSTAPAGGLPAAPTVALAALEDWLDQNYAAQGVLHVGTWVATHLMGANLLHVSDDGSVRTVVGTPVVVGAGYNRPGQSENYMFASGQVVLVRGPREVKEVPMTTGVSFINESVYLAHRSYVPLIECGSAIVDVTLA